jgi:hypothetical protein
VAPRDRECRAIFLGARDGASSDSARISSSANKRIHRNYFTYG